LNCCSIKELQKAERLAAVKGATDVIKLIDGSSVKGEVA
jgi:hypothetical protein